MERMTDADAKALLNILASDRLPVVSTERRQAVILHALQAIEDRVKLVEALEHHARASACGAWPQARDARYHMEGK